MVTDVDDRRGKGEAKVSCSSNGKVVFFGKIVLFRCSKTSNLDSYHRTHDNSG